MSDERASQRRVGGLWCGEVLERLPDLVEGELTPQELERVRAHVEGCDWCARFGGRYAALVGALREGEVAPAPEGLADRLRRRLAALTD